jgi:hypothetical protein
MTPLRIALLALVACETAEPTPIVPEPPPPPPADAGPPPTPDAPPAVANPNCFANGPKEFIRITTDPATNQGVLHRMTTSRVPDRWIRYSLRADGPAALDLVFEGYEPKDYKRWRNLPVDKPREKLEVGKSVIARVFVKDGKSYITDADVDLSTGMATYPDNAHVCDDRRR